jgi:hypothetical protein
MWLPLVVVEKRSRLLKMVCDNFIDIQKKVQ